MSLSECFWVGRVGGLFHYKDKKHFIDSYINLKINMNPIFIFLFISVFIYLRMFHSN